MFYVGSITGQTQIGSRLERLYDSTAHVCLYGAHSLSYSRFQVPWILFLELTF